MRALATVACIFTMVSPAFSATIHERNSSISSERSWLALAMTSQSAAAWCGTPVPHGGLTPRTRTTGPARASSSAHGSREMPVWGQRFAEAIPEAGVGDEVARGKIASLVEYLKSIQRRD